MSHKIKYVFFDFMGTCLDWHESITNSLPLALSDEQRSDIALTWREAFFREIAARFAAGDPPEDIDSTHRRALEAVLTNLPEKQRLAFSEDDKKKAVEAWHLQKAWPDVAGELEKMRVDLGWEVFVLANGTTRLQLDLVRSSGLRYDMLFSSELLGLYKPDPNAYLKAMNLVGARVDECVMVAAHAYDLKAARKLGMKTVYVYRWTDDRQEDQEEVMAANDAYLVGMEGLAETIRDIME